MIGECSVVGAWVTDAIDATPSAFATELSGISAHPDPAFADALVAGAVAAVWLTEADAGAALALLGPDVTGGSTAAVVDAAGLALLDAVAVAT